MSSYLAALLSGSDNWAFGTFTNGNFFSTAVVNGSLAVAPFNPQFIISSLQGVLAAQHAATLGASGTSPSTAQTRGSGTFGNFSHLAIGCGEGTGKRR